MSSSITSSISHTNEIVDVLNLLKALRDPTNVGHIAALETLPNMISSKLSTGSGIEYAINSPFVLNMLFIFVYGSMYESAGITSDIRQLSGLIIKNYCLPLLNHLDGNLQIQMKEGNLNIFLKYSLI